MHGGTYGVLVVSALDLREKPLYPGIRPPRQNVWLSPILRAVAQALALAPVDQSSAKPQGPHPAAREKSVGGSGLTEMDIHPVAKDGENVESSMSIPILVSDFEGANKSEEMEVTVPMRRRSNIGTRLP